MNGETARLAGNVSPIVPTEALLKSPARHIDDASSYISVSSPDTVAGDSDSEVYCSPEADPLCEGNKRKRGRPFKAEALRRERGNSIGSIRDFFRKDRSKEELANNFERTLKRPNKRFGVTQQEERQGEEHEARANISKGTNPATSMGDNGEKIAEDTVQTYQLLIDEIRGLREDNKKQASELKQKIEDTYEDTKEEIKNLRQELERQEDKFSAAWKRTNERIGVLEKKFKDLDLEAVSHTWEEKLKAVEAKAAAAAATVRSGELDQDTASKIEKLQGMVEKLESDRRRNNVIIRGLDTDVPVTAQAVQEYLGYTFRIRCNVLMARKIGDVRILAELDSAAAKAEIMRMKSTVLKDTQVFIDHDLPPEARTRAKEIRIFVKKERRNGSSVRVEGQRVKVDGRWWHWSSDDKAMVLSKRTKSATDTQSGDVAGEENPEQGN